MHVRMLEELLFGRILQHFVSHKLFEDLSMIDLLLKRVIYHEPIDLYISLLADSKCPVCRLNVDHGIPIWVKDYDLVSRSQVDTKSTDSGSQQEQVVIIC